ncbi:Similar to Oca2: P protein (Mus musculus), partial [Cotesia congregata]
GRYYRSKKKYNDIEDSFSLKVKPIYRYIKLGFLVTYWLIFTVTHVDIEIAGEPISDKVKLNLEGPLVPVLQTDDVNPSYHIIVWLELIADYNNTDNYSQALTERWVVPILPLNLLQVFPKQEAQKTLDVLKYDRKLAGRLRLSFETNSPKKLKISYVLDLSPATADNGLLYGTIILFGLYFFIIFDVINRALAAMLASTMSLAVLALLNQITNGKVWPLIYTLCIFTAILSSFLDNTTMVLLMTPVTIRLCEVMELNPVPILTAMVIYSNIGGTLTPVGDPPNVIITTNKKVIAAGVDFSNFVLHMSIGVVLAVIVASFQLKHIFHDTKLLKFGEPLQIQEMRHEIAIWQRAAASLSSYSREEKLVRDILLQKVQTLSAALDSKLTTGRISSLKYRSTLEELQDKYQIRDKWMLLKTSITLIFVIVLFFLHNLPNVNLSLGWTTLLGVFLILILADTKDLDGILARVEWSTLIFFAALFILMEALSCLGLIAWIGKQTEIIILSVREEFRLAVAIILILWVSGIASAFVDNVSLTTMMIRIITNLSQNNELGLPLQPLVWALAYGACMGGNATLIGATANVVCAGVAEQHGYPFTFMQFFK